MKQEATQGVKQAVHTRVRDLHKYTFPEFLNYAKTGVTHFCGKKASHSNTLSASLLIFKISHPLEKKKCNIEKLRSDPYKKSAELIFAGINFRDFMFLLSSPGVILCFWPI